MNGRTQQPDGKLEMSGTISEDGDTITNGRFYIEQPYFGDTRSTLVTFESIPYRDPARKPDSQFYRYQLTGEEAIRNGVKVSGTLKTPDGTVKETITGIEFGDFGPAFAVVFRR